MKTTIKFFFKSPLSNRDDRVFCEADLVTFWGLEGKEAEIDHELVHASGYIAGKILSALHTEPNFYLIEIGKET